MHLRFAHISLLLNMEFCNSWAICNFTFHFLFKLEIVSTCLWISKHSEFGNYTFHVIFAFYDFNFGKFMEFFSPCTWLFQKNVFSIWEMQMSLFIITVNNHILCKLSMSQLNLLCYDRGMWCPLLWFLSVCYVFLKALPYKFRCYLMWCKMIYNYYHSLTLTSFSHFFSKAIFSFNAFCIKFSFDVTISPLFVWSAFFMEYIFHYFRHFCMMI